MSDFEPEYLEPEKRGVIASMRYAIGQTEGDDDLVAVSFDVSANREMYLSTEELLEVAEHVFDVEAEGEEGSDV